MTEELSKKFDLLKKEFSEIKLEMKEISNIKEEAYRKLRSITDKIKDRNQKIKLLKGERDGFTSQVRELKKQRDSLNKDVKKISDKKRDADQKRRDSLSDKNFEDDPKKIKKEIEMLEEKVEIEVISFKKEKEINKRVKMLKAQLALLDDVSEIIDKASEVHGNFIVSKKKAEEVHKEIQVLAEKSQQRHELISGIIGEIKELRVKEKPLSKEYLENKSKFEDLKKVADEKSKVLDEIRADLGLQNKNDHKNKIKERTREVKEKMKSGKKLSTEDILAFQAQ